MIFLFHYILCIYIYLSMPYLHAGVNLFNDKLKSYVYVCVSDFYFNIYCVYVYMDTYMYI